MKVLKIIAALLLSAVLFVSAGLAMGSFAAGEAISEEAIEKAIVDTGAVDKLTDNILAQNTTNLGAGYGQTMKTILKSDAMTQFFTEYTASCLQSKVYEETYEEIGSDELNEAFQRGTDECMADGSIAMGEMERKVFDEALNLAMPVLTEGVNYVLKQMNLSSFVDEDTAQQIEMAQSITSDTLRFGACAVAAACCLIILLLFHRSKMGLIWCGVCILIIAVFFGIFAVMLDQTVASSGENIVLSRQMLYVMVAHGLKYVAVAGGALGAACFPACLILRKIFR